MLKFLQLVGSNAFEYLMLVLNVVLFPIILIGLLCAIIRYWFNVGYFTATFYLNSKK